MYKIDAHMRQRGHCPYCTYQIPLSEATAEHKLPVSRGGLTRPENIDSACSGCNRSKGSLTKDEFLRAIVQPDIKKDPWETYLAAMSIRMKRATEAACRRIASIC